MDSDIVRLKSGLLHMWTYIVHELDNYEHACNLSRPIEYSPTLQVIRH